MGIRTLALDWCQIQLPWMTLNAKIGGFMDFFGDFGLWYRSISFIRWRHTTIVM